MDNEFHGVVDALPGLVWTALPDGNVDFVNQDWCEYTGRSREQAHGQGWHVAVHPDDLSALLQRWQTLLEAGVGGEIETRLRRFDGEHRRFVIRARPVTDSSGKVVKWCGVNTDVEDHRRAEASARSHQLDFRSFADCIPGLLALMAPTGALEYANRETLEYLGVSLEELKNRAGTETVHPDDLPAVLAAWMRSVESGEPYDIEHRVRRFDGAYRWFHVRGLPLRNSEGRIARWCVLKEDIDDQRQGEAVLAGEKRLFEMVVRGHPRSEVLDALCRLVEDTIGGCFCSIVVLDPSGTCMEQGAAPSLSASFIRSIIGRPVHIDGGPCPMAARLVEQVIVTDLAAESRWAGSGWCRMAMAHGLRACLSTPIKAAAGEVLGAIAIYYERAKSPSSRELALIERLSHVVSVVVERHRSQANLARALDELGASEHRLRTTIDAMPGFAWRASPDGGVEFLNQRWCDYTGLGMPESLGIGWTTAIHPDDTSALGAYWQGLLQAARPGEFEARLRGVDGSFRWFLIRAVPLLDDAGNVLKWYGQNTDIDDRKRAELLLAGEKKLLKMIAESSALAPVLGELCKLVESTIDGSSCGVQLADAKRTPLRLQAGVAPHLPPELMEGPDGAPVNEESGPAAMAALFERQVESSDLSSETRWKAWASLALSHGYRAALANPIVSSSGHVMGIFVLLGRDPVTSTPQQQELIGQFTSLASIAIERALGEAALKQSEAFLAKAQRLSLTGTFSWRVATNEITWSDEVYRIYEMDPAVTPTYDLIQTRLHPEDSLAYNEVRKRQRVEGKDFEHEHRLLMPDGSVKYLHLVAQATRDPGGGLEYIAALQDVTQRRLSEEALARARSELAHVSRVATLGALTASIAHEVNQPLAGIITNANTCLRMLGADPPNVEGARETARRTIRDGNRASDVIKRLRALFAKKDVTTDRVDLNEASREVVAMLQDELHRHGIAVVEDHAVDLPSVLGDRVQLQQVILNLLANAVDAMSGVVDRARTIVVRTGRDGVEQVRLTVQDSGVGFEPLDAEKLFTAFYTTKNGGMGIGLSISRSIIETHYGRLWATANDGVGAAFSFSIPCLPDAAIGLRGAKGDRPQVVGTVEHRGVGSI